MLEQRVKIGDGGRVIIPVAYRKALHVEPGDELVICLQDGELRLFHQTQALKRLRQSVKRPSGKSATDDFIAFRKQDGGQD